ncbi:MAG: site-specific integrase [Thermoanaerobaculia bacterium]
MPRKKKKQTGWPKQIGPDTWVIRYYAGRSTAAAAVDPETGKRKRIRSTYTQETLKGYTAEEAKAKYQERCAEASSRRLNGSGSDRITFAQLAARYLETKKMSESGRERAEAIITQHLNPHFGTMRVSAIKAGDVEAYQAKRQKSVKDSTINREWNALRAVLRWGFRSLDVQCPALGRVSSIETDDRKTVYFAREEWEHFVTAFDDQERWRAYRAKVRHFGPVKLGASATVERRFGAGMKPDSEASDEYLERLREFRPVFITLLFTASRLGEVLSLKWEDVDFNHGTVTLTQSKVRNRVKTVPMAPQLRATLEQLPRGTPAALVFQRDGRPYYNAEVQRAFNAAKKIAGLRDELTPHTIRHTAASWMAISGKPLRTIQVALGHSNIATTTRYAHLSPEHMAEAFNILGDDSEKVASGTPAARVAARASGDDSAKG